MKSTTSTSISSRYNKITELPIVPLSLDELLKLAAKTRGHHQYEVLKVIVSLLAAEKRPRYED